MAKVTIWINNADCTGRANGRKRSSKALRRHRTHRGLAGASRDRPPLSWRSVRFNIQQPAHAIERGKLVGTVYHGLPADSLRPVFESGSYLAFLGRLSKEKGPDAAMRIARAAGMALH